MNKEQEQSVDEAYALYLNETKIYHYPNSLILLKEEFIDKIKTDSKFSKTWGIKIEERELSLEERRVIWNVKVEPSENACEYVDNLSITDAHDIFDQDEVPTKQITLTYNNETIESYE